MAGSKERKEKRSRSGGRRFLFWSSSSTRASQAAAGGETSQRIQEIKGLLCIGIALWLFVSLLSYDRSGALGGKNWGGQAGWYLASWGFRGLGWSGYILALLGLAWGGVLVARKTIDWPIVRVIGSACFLLCSALLFQLALGDTHGQDLPYGPGGYLALELVGSGVGGDRVPPILVEKLGRPGLWILLILSTLISFMLATEMAFYPAAIAFRDWIAERHGEGGENAPAAILGWLKRLLVGLWSFLRGADLEPGPAGAAVPAPPANAPRKRSRALPLESVPEGPAQLFGEEDDEEVADVDWAADDDDDDGEVAGGDDDKVADADDDAEVADDDYDGDLDDWNAAREVTPEPRPARAPPRREKPLVASGEPPTPPPATGSSRPWSCSSRPARRTPMTSARSRLRRGGSRTR